MPYQPNIYYDIAEFGADALMASETLLKSYPLSKVCLDILGKRLLRKLEFGFFEAGYQIIRQGEQGKDLYLLCNHIADVIVFDKVIVQMEAPALFGDKAIIDRNSTRNATIRVAEGDQSLVLKIPIGRFLRDFKQADVEDVSFEQEKQMFYNLFLEIQNRLFKYSEIQKRLWDEVNKQLKLLNIQLISNVLSKQEEQDWEPKVWQVILQYLKAVHKVTWPDSVKPAVKTLIDILRTILDKRFSGSSFRGTQQAYQFQKQLIWRRWLETLSELLIKVLPNSKLPVSIGDVELFNPRIYQMRMHTLLVSIQRNFMFKKVLPREERYDSEKLKASNFFSKKQSVSEFNLEAYLKTLDEMFVLKKPNRVLAQVAQQTAQLSATCENEFNSSVSKMKRLLEKVKKLSRIKQEDSADEAARNKELKEKIATINQGFKAYNSRIIGHTYTYAGVIRFADGKVPTIKELIRATASEVLKKKLTRAFNSLTTQFGLAPDGYPADRLQELFYLCQGSSEDIIPEDQLMSHYWIPISEGISLIKGEKSFGSLKPGSLLGGHSWGISMKEEGEEEEKEEWHLKMPKKATDQSLDDLFLILAIPHKRLPWMRNSDPSPDEFQKMYIPILQWMVFKNLETISLISELRDTYIKKYSQVVEVVVTERKVREFEENPNRLPQEKYNRILKLVYDILGITLEKQPSMSSEKISKQIYNEILKQTQRDYPKLNAEERGNKSYTLWRFVQSEIVSKVFADESSGESKLDPPKSVFLLIKEEMENYFREAGADLPEASYKLTPEGGEINLKEIIQADGTVALKDRLKILLAVSGLVAQHLNRLVDDTNTYLARLKQISSIQTEFNVNEIHSRVILDAIAKLQYSLQNKGSSQETMTAPSAGH